MSGFSGEASVLLWPSGAPGAMGGNERDKPCLIPHFPAAGDGARRPAVVICPGGAYGELMMGYEGRDVARWLHEQGMAGVVLKYRVSPYRHPAPMLDGQRAVRWVRYHAEEWGIDPQKIGMMGFSAGGHLASTVGTRFDAGEAGAEDPVDRVSCRPDFLVLVYPVVTMGEKGHGGSRRNLLGDAPRADDIEWLSNEKHVTAETPPTFLVHARTDGSVPVENSILFHNALKERGVPTEFMELPEGEHGLGCGQGRLWEAWQAQCLAWLRMEVM